MVVAQLVERPLPIPEVSGLNLVICKNLYIEYLFTVNFIEKTKIKEKEAGNGPIFKEMVSIKSCKQPHYFLLLWWVSSSLYLGNALLKYFHRGYILVNTTIVTCRVFTNLVHKFNMKFQSLFKIFCIQCHRRILWLRNSRSPSVWPDWVIYWTLGNFSKPLATIILPKSPTF